MARDGGSKSGGTRTGKGGDKAPRKNAKGQGRKRTPTAMKRAQGNPGKRKLNEQEPHGGNVVLFPGAEGGAAEKPKAAKGRGGPKSKRTDKAKGGDVRMWMPEELQADPIAAGQWQVLAPQLVRNGVLQKTDVNMLIGACQAFSLGQQARMILLSDGGPVLEEEVYDKEGNVTGYRKKRHPAAIQYKESMALYRAYASELGLTPASRAGLIGGAQREDADEAFFGGA